MKFPLSHLPFGNYPALSEAQTEHIEMTVQRTLSKTLVEYDQNQLQLLPRSQYKVVKKVENLICYRTRSTVSAGRETRHFPGYNTSRSSISLTALGSFLPSARYGNSGSFWPSPTLITVGTMAGTLNDVMYGLLATDATSTFNRASYTNEELLDTALLHSIRSPSPSQPFQFCGVKWQVTKAASKRDFVFVEASGVVIRSNGKRIGYHIMHSVDLPGLDELSSCYQVLRGRVMSCHLFRQLSHNTVDVFIKGVVDPSGYMRGAVAIASTANTLLKFSHAVECSHSKKLEYLLELEQLKQGDTLRGERRRSNNLTKVSKSIRSSSTCTVCATTFHLFRSVAHCELCSEGVCSRCRVTRRLSHRVARLKDRKQQNMIFCKACVAKASAYSATDVARIELIAQSAFMATEPDVNNRSTSTKLRAFLTSSTLSSSNSSHFAMKRNEHLLPQRGNLNIYDLPVPVRRRSMTHPPVIFEKLDIKVLEELEPTPNSPLAHSSYDYLDFDESVTSRRKTQSPHSNSALMVFEPVCPPARSMPLKSSASMMTSELWHQRELMRRMKELQKNAENVYQLTWRNTQSMRSGGVRLLAESSCGA